MQELRITNDGLDITRSGQVQVELEDLIGETWAIILDSSGLTEGLSLTRVGSGVREFRVDNSGNIYSSGTQLVVPDHVFEPNYELMPLIELETFISKKKHLPNISSAEDVKKKGLNVTGMQMKLLGKIEELTLYTIAQEKTITGLLERLAALETRDVIY